MADTITVKFKVVQDGDGFKLVGQEAEAAAAGVDKATASGDKYQKKNKGVAQATSNSTKAFSKMTTGITGGLVPAYATLAANVFALSAAFNFFKRAADVKILEEGQASFAATSGVALQSITSNLRDAAGGMLGFREAAEAAAIGVAKGFSPQQLNELAEGARKASAALGRNFEDAFDRLIRGASKAEPELLDELGITLRLADASARYADTIGKTAKELTTFEKSQAVLIETQRQLNEMYGGMEMVSNPFVQLAKTFDDIVKAGSNFIMPLFAGLANIINNSAIAAVAVFGAVGVSIFKMAIPLDSIKESLDEWGDKAAAASDRASRRLAAYNRLLEQTNKKIAAASGKGLQNTAQGMQARGVGTGSKLVSKAAAGQLVDPKQQGQLKAHLNKALVQFKKYGEVRTGILKGATKQELLDMKMGLKQQQMATKKSYNAMGLTIKKFGLGTKAVFMQIRAAGVTTAAAIGKGFMKMGGMMNMALRGAGIIGLLVMIVEMGRELMKSPYDIMLSILKGLDKIISAVVNGFGNLIDMIAEPLDNVLNKARGMFNTLIKGFNKARKLVGKEPIDLLKTDGTGIQDMAKDLMNFKSTLADSFKNSGVGEFLLDIQKTNRSAAQTKQAFDELKDSIGTMGSDMRNITDGVITVMDKSIEGLNKQLKEGKITSEQFADAMHGLKASLEVKRAAAIATLGVGALMRKIEKETDPDKKADLQRRLQEATQTAGTISLEFAKAIREGNLEAVEGMEKTALDAGASFTALKTAIMDVGQAISGGNLLQAEATLTTLNGVAEQTGEHFKKLFGENAAAATKAMQDFEAALKEAGMTTSEYLQRLRNLRQAQNDLAKDKVLADAIGGQVGEMKKRMIEVQDIMNQIEAINIRLATVSGADKIGLEDQKKLLEVKLAIAEADAAAGSAGQMGQGMNRMVALMNVMKEDFDAASIVGKLNMVSNSMLQMQASFSAMGPEGKAIADMLGGFAMLTEAVANFETAIEKLEESLAQACFEGGMNLKELWQSADTLADKGKIVGAVAGMMADAFGAMAQIARAKFDKAIAGVDKLIEREKAMDGQSAASVAKLKALEAKKEAMKRKAFETDKKLKLAQAVMSTAAGVANALSLPPPLNFIMAGLVAAMGAMQINMISGMTYDGGGKTPDAPSKVSMGERSNSVDLAKGNNARGEIAYMRGERGQGTGASDFRPAAAGYRHRAGGGYVVGEQGPEVFVPEVPGEIVPAGQPVGGTTNVNFSISAVDQTGVEDLLIAQRGSIIGMIREAANENGEFFLETVDETAY